MHQMRQDYNLMKQKSKLALRGRLGPREGIWSGESLAQKSQLWQGGWIGLKGQLDLEQNLAQRG